MRKIFFHIAVLTILFAGFVCGGNGDNKNKGKDTTNTKNKPAKFSPIIGTYDTVLSGVRENLYGIHYSAPNRGFIVGAKGTILKTSTGTKWKPTGSGVISTLNGVFALSDTLTAIVVGDSGIVLRTADNGTVWTPIPVPKKVNLRGVSFANKTEGIIVGDGGTILHTNDGGLTWADLPHTLVNLPNLRSVSFMHETENSQSYQLVIVGAGGTVLYNTSGNYKLGLTIVTLPETQLNSVSFPYTNKGKDADKTGYTVGSTGKIFKSVDRGHTWSLVFTAAKPLNGVHSPINSLVFAVGDSGAVVRYSPKTNWQALSQPTSKKLNWVDPNESYPTATCVGDYGEIYLINPPPAEGFIAELTDMIDLCRWKVTLSVSPAGTPTAEGNQYNAFQVCSRTRFIFNEGDGPGAGWTVYDDGSIYNRVLQPLNTESRGFTFTVAAPYYEGDPGYLSFYMLDKDNCPYVVSSYEIRCTTSPPTPGAH